jgi:hypothetical protein
LARNIPRKIKGKNFWLFLSLRKEFPSPSNTRNFPTFGFGEKYLKHYLPQEDLISSHNSPPLLSLKSFLPLSIPPMFLVCF